MTPRAVNHDRSNFETVVLRHTGQLGLGVVVVYELRRGDGSRVESYDVTEDEQRRRIRVPSVDGTGREGWYWTSACRVPAHMLDRSMPVPAGWRELRRYDARVVPEA